MFILDMETRFLNFNDEAYFSDFSLSLDHQHNLLGESQSTLFQMVDSDFDYVESLGFDSNDALWETEQELNGDLAVLPVSGVADLTPKMENIKEDFAKVLTDWQEHIGYLQASEIEEDIDFANLDMGLHFNPSSVDNVFESTLKSTEKLTNSFMKYEEHPKHLNNPLNNDIISDIKCPKTSSILESNQSEKEIDVVGIDSVGDVNSIMDFINGRRQHAIIPFIERNSKTLGANTISIKQQPIDIIVKEEPQKLVDEIFPTIFSRSIQNSEFLKNNKKKHSRKYKGKFSNRKNRKTVKVTSKLIAKLSKKTQKDIQIKNYIQKSNNSKNISSTSQKAPVLEAGDVKSLLEQFEATEAASISCEILRTTSKPVASNFPVNKSQVTLLKKFVNSQDSKLYQDIRDSLPKEVIDRIKASACKKIISVLPAVPNINTGIKNKGTRIQQAAAIFSRNKLLKLVTNSKFNSNGRNDGLVQLDHDYCTNSSSFQINSTTNNSNNNSSNNFEYSSEYTREINDTEELNLIKEKSSKKKDDCYNEDALNHLNFINYKVAFADKVNWIDNGSKKDSGLESGDVSDASEEQLALKTKGSLLQEANKELNQLNNIHSKAGILDKSKILLINKVNVTQKKPLYEMKIQSALATSILQLRKGVLTKTKSLDTHKPMQMISVLKKPPGAVIPQKNLRSHLKESIVTTTNSLNDKIQNIIIQNTADVKFSEEKEKKPPRRKLNLAEYRSRFEHIRSDGTHTNSPVQPMVLVYIHHVSTNTKPINDFQDNAIWSEREIVSVLKPKVEIEQQKFKTKRPTKDKGMQTTETVLNISFNKNEVEELRENHELENKKEQKQQFIKNIIDKMNIDDVVLVKKKFIADKIMDNEVKNDEIKNVEAINNKVSNDNIEFININLVNNKEKATQIKSLNYMQNCNSRSYKRVHALTRSTHSSSISSNHSRSRSLSRNRRGRYLHQPLNCNRSTHSSCNRSRSRSCSYSRSRSHSRSCSSSRSRSRSRNRDRSRSHSQSRSRSRSHSNSCSNRFERTRTKTHNQECNRSRSSSKSTGSSRSKSQNRNRSRARCQAKRRKISHRRSSVSSSSSWSSPSRSRSRSSPRYRFFSRSRSRSRSSSSRSRSSRNSSCSRFSSRSNFGCSKWSSCRRKENREYRRIYDRLRRHSSGSSHGYIWRRSSLSSYRRPYDDWFIKEKQRQVEERRVIYVGRLKEGITKAELRRRFEIFGPVVDISVHFRERGHNYGFVTFAYKNDAYKAVEHGNDDPSLPRYDLCFGGRRAFCKVKYADLDGAASNSLGGSRTSMFKPEEENTFDLLLKEAQAKLRKRKV